MNKVIMSGRLTKDPTVRYSTEGKGVASFSIATERRFKRDGEPTADFFYCVCFGKTAELIEKYFTKGKQILICGEVRNEEYTNKDGQKVRTTKIYVEEINFMGEKQNGQNGGQNAPQAQQQQKPSGDEFMNVSIDDELPFQ